MKRILCIGVCILSFTVSLAACGGGIFPDGHKGEWKTHLAYITGVRIPGSARVSAPMNIVATTYAFPDARIEKRIDVSPQTHTVGIAIYLSYLETGDPRICIAPPPVDIPVKVSFPELGAWMVQVEGADNKEFSQRVAVYGEWVGEERPARSTGIDLPRWLYSGRSNRLHATIAHESGEWFYSSWEAAVDEEGAAVDISVRERQAESALPEQDWEESVEIPVVFPVAGWWRVNIGSEAFAVRSVIDWPYDYPPPTVDPYYSEYSRLWSPEVVEIPHDAYANSPATLVILATPKTPDLEVLGFDFVLDTEAMELSARMWVPPHWQDVTWETTEPTRYEVDLTFPTPGEWTIRFEGEEGVEPFIRVLNVLPAEE